MECKNCNTDISSMNKNTIYCSVNCRKKYNYDNNEELREYTKNKVKKYRQKKMDKTELKHRIKEELIEEYYYLSVVMRNDDIPKIKLQKEKINKLLNEYLDLLN